MAVCKKCGQEIEDSVLVCPHCGEVQEPAVEAQEQKVAEEAQAAAPESPQVDPAAQAQAAQDAAQAQAQQNYQAPPQGGYQQPAPTDNGGFGWGLLGFCIPIVGLILFLVWKDDKPRTAKAAGLGALISVIIGGLSYVGLMALGVLGAAVGGM